MWGALVACLRAGRSRRSLAMVVVLTAAACSSGHARRAASGSQETSTSTPTAAGATRTFFARTGALLLSLERASRSLTTGTQPSRAECQQFLDGVHASVGSTKVLDELVQGIPDVLLRRAVTTDLDNKLSLAQTCVSRTGLNNTPREMKVLAVDRLDSARVLHLLERDHISP